MDFEFSPEQQAFRDEVRAFCDEHDDPEIFDVTRENMAQIVDTPKRRAFMKEIGRKGWLGMTWPKEYGGSEGEGVYEYILNEELAGRGGPQIGKGVGIIGKTLIRHGSDFLKEKFLPMILRTTSSSPWATPSPTRVRRGVDAAQRRAPHRGGRHHRLAAERAEDVDDLGALRRVVLVRRARPGQQAHGHHADAHPDGPPGITINGIWTMGDERTNEVWLDDVFVPDEYVVGEVNHGFRYISQALDLERFTMFTYAPIKQRLDVLTEYVRTAERDGEPLRDDPVVRARMARLHTDAEVARVMGLKFVAEAVKVEKAAREGKEFQPPTVAASEYKLFATELSKRLANASMDIAGPGSQLRVRTEDAPMEGRSESTYRYTVIDTIGGGASEIQKNIIARRGLGLPKNF